MILYKVNKVTKAHDYAAKASKKNSPLWVLTNGSIASVVTDNHNAYLCASRYENGVLKKRGVQ